MELNCVCIVGWSGSGKTTLIEALLHEFSRRKINAGALKHSSDAHPLDRSGSDSERFSTAGASWVGFTSAAGLQITLKGSTQENLGRLINAVHDLGEIVFVEGWKNGPYPKIEILRLDLGPALYAQDASVRAIVSETDPPNCRLPVFRRHQLNELADWILENFRPDERTHERQPLAKEF